MGRERHAVSAVSAGPPFTKTLGVDGLPAERTSIAFRKF